jgi:hypothetical protein
MPIDGVERVLFKITPPEVRPLPKYIRQKRVAGMRKHSKTIIIKHVKLKYSSFETFPTRTVHQLQIPM